MGFLKIGALWKKEGNNGKYLGGPVKEEVVLPAGAKLFAFPVKDKTHENSPDFELCLAVEDEDQPRQGGKFQGRNNASQQGQGQQRQQNQGGGQRQQGNASQQGRNQGQQGQGSRQPRQQEEDVNPDDFDF